MRELISKFGERRKRIVMVSQALAPLGTRMSFANHNISWIHNSNYISLRMVKLKYNKAPPFTFLQPRRTFENAIFISEMCRFTGDCQSSQINLLATVWQIRRWPFTDSDLIVAGIRFIISSLHWNWQLYSYKSNTLVRQRRIVLFRAPSHSIDESPTDLFIVGKHRDQNSSIHRSTSLVKIKALVQAQPPSFIMNLRLEQYVIIDSKNEMYQLVSPLSP